MANLLHSVDSSVVESMQGVLAVRPYVPKSGELYDFRVKWKKKFLNETSKIERTEPSTYDLWAYDAVWALAMAVEEVGGIVYPFQKPKVIDNSSDLATLGISQIGPKLLQSIQKIKFKGLSGEFRLVNGQLQASIIQILNVNGDEGKEIGFWTPKNGILRHLSTSAVNDTAASYLGVIIWPGESVVVPRDWALPFNGRPLSVGFPHKTQFREFVSVTWDPKTKSTSVSGYSIDVFKAAIETLPYPVPYEFIPLTIPNHGIFATYDDLIYQIYFHNFDAVVGDVSILSSRSLYVDFTSPYTETGLSMVIPIKEDQKKVAWYFLEPLSMETWVSTVAAFLFTGSVIWALEHRTNTYFRGSPTEQLGTIFWFSSLTLVFAHSEKVRSNLSRLVLIIWIFVVLILTSSYTAILSSSLTVKQLAVSDFDQLIKSGAYVGYQQGSYVKDVLKILRFDESKLRAYSSPEEYAAALSRGSSDGGVAAIIDELPYLKLFLAKFCNKFSMVGPTYNTNGFGFVFRKGSPLTADFSKAISKLIDDGTIRQIEPNWFGNRTNCGDLGSDDPLHSLTIDSFRGLFLMTILTSILALIISFGSFLHDHMHILTDSSPENISMIQRFKNLGIKFLQEEESPSITSNRVKLDEERQEQVIDSSPTPSRETMLINIHNEEDGIITSLDDEPDESSSCPDSRNDIELSPM